VKLSLQQAESEADDAIMMVRDAADQMLEDTEVDDEQLFAAIDVYYESVRQLRKAHHREFRSHRRRFKTRSQEADTCP
jgi:hypothetical protein